jgi:hypothetical protein
VLTALGAKVSHCFTKLHSRVFGAGLAAMEPQQPLPTLLATARTSLVLQIETLLREAQIGLPGVA